MISDKLKIVLGDITEQSVDAIVNAANSSLLGGGGVDGAIHRAAGKRLLEECRTLGGCPPGEARATKGYDLRARYVIHTVGPIWRDGAQNEEHTLAECYRSVFKTARDLGVHTIAFPSISTGAYGFPLERACRIALNEVLRELAAHSWLDEVTIVCFDSTTFAAYERTLKSIAS